MSGAPRRGGPRHLATSSRRGAAVLRAALVAALVATASLAALLVLVPAPEVPPVLTTPAADPGRVSAEPLWPVSAWQERFDEQWSATREPTVVLSRSPDSWDHYQLAYSVDALTAAYRATGSARYLEDGLLLVEGVVASAQPVRGLPGSQYQDGYSGWASEREDVRGQEVPLFESYFWRYAVQLVAAVDASPALRGTPADQRAAAVLAFAERHVFDKWWSRGPEDTVFRSRTHLSAHWALIAVTLRDLTEQPRRRAACDEVLAAFGGAGEQSLRAQVGPNPQHLGAVLWNDDWGSDARPGQDVAHGNGVVAFVVEAHDRGAGWSDRDVTGFVRTFTDVVWPAEGPGSEHVDGTGTGTGWFSDGFAKLGRYDEELQRRLQRHEPANAQFYANGALNAAVLACRPADGAEAREPACADLPS